MESAAPPKTLPTVAMTVTLSAIAIAVMWRVIAVDMSVHLLPWFDHIVATGPLAAFARPFSNYSPAYLYLMAATTPLATVFSGASLIKALSVVGTIALALSVRRLLVRLGAPQPNRGAALMLITPTIAINAGLLGQCDAMWTAPLVMALVAMLNRRHVAMLVWCGLALGFKVQALLVAPFFVGLLINRKIPLRLWPIAPLVAAATMVPAWALGWPAGDLATIYLRQADTYSALSLNAPNVWTIVQGLPVGGAFLPGLALVAAAALTAAYVMWLSVTRLAERALIWAALLAPLITAGLLPRMHERYFFMADILAIVIALTVRDRRSWRIAALIQGGSLLSLFAFISGIAGFAALGAVLMILATMMVARPLLKRAANNTAGPAQTA
jgi:Gpi18-like mannosyltransferase